MKKKRSAPSQNLDENILPRIPEGLHPVMGSLFMDSGAHGLYNRHAKGHGVDGYNLWGQPEAYAKQYAFFDTKEFYKYLDDYAAFLKSPLGQSVDYYVNVDVIFNPEKSWTSLKYLEEKHGLHPIPVLHFNTPMKWVEKHLKAGYKFLGLGGLGQDTAFDGYAIWADQVYARICDNQDRLPTVKTHGFAMTSWRSIFRYPWWSVDSTSWVKMAAYGGVFFPRQRQSGWVFDEMPRVARFTWGCLIPSKVDKLHYLDFSPLERKRVQEWLEFLDIPLGSFDENGQEVTKGVMTDWTIRARANLLFFEHMRKAQPEWPWPFRVEMKQGFSINTHS